MTTIEEYSRNLQSLIQYLKGNRKALVKDIEKEMKREAKSHNFEKAAKLRNQLASLKTLEQQTIFGDRENLDLSKDAGLVELGQILGISPPKRIEGFDISHMSGTDNVASMVVFTYGVPDKSQYRKFKMRSPGNDDFKHMREVMQRRFSQANLKRWARPDLVVIDGGKGQVSSALSILNTLSIDVTTIGLAKRYEEVVIPRQLNATKSQLEIVRLPKNSNALKLLMRIRDESHRFAVSYHSTLKRARQTANVLDEINGIGKETRKKLIKHFGSSKRVSLADPKDIIELIGESKAQKVIKALQ